MKSLEKDITVKVVQGVHGRIATGLAQIARQHNVELCILRDGEEIDCTSVLDVLSMGFASGTRMKFRVTGKGAGQVIKAVEKLLKTSKIP